MHVKFLKLTNFVRVRTIEATTTHMSEVKSLPHLLLSSHKATHLSFISQTLAKHGSSNNMIKRCKFEADRKKN